jgi:hypothetical protein
MCSSCTCPHFRIGTSGTCGSLMRNSVYTCELGAEEMPASTCWFGGGSVGAWAERGMSALSDRLERDGGAVVV